MEASFKHEHYTIVCLAILLPPRLLDEILNSSSALKEGGYLIDDQSAGYSQSALWQAVGRICRRRATHRLGIAADLSSVLTDEGANLYGRGTPHAPATLLSHEDFQRELEALSDDTIESALRPGASGTQTALHSRLGKRLLC